MLFQDEEADLRRSYLLIGQDLSDLGADELQERIQWLEAEIQRMRHEISSKGNSRAAAEALFRSP